MVSRVIFFLLSCLCISFTTALSDSILQLVCKDACNRCTGSQGWAYCSLCHCNTNQRSSGPCATKRCPIGETCKVSRGGWFRKQYAVCVAQSTTTTTRVTTTLAADGCRANAECPRNEICVISTGKSVGTCKVVGGRTISERCVEERRVETCRARFPKYFYNVSAGECQGFNYGGCNPGLNHFDSLEDCQQECVDSRSASSVVAKDPDCLLQKDQGICRALINSFYYNSETKLCEEFFYGGCGGNANRFLTKDECVSKCVGS